MLDTLQKMSGTTHKAFTNSKTVTRDMSAIFRSISANEGKVSYTMSTQEVPVISYNDMAFIAERNSIVFRAGDSPIWNRNETILPMSWRLFKNTIIQPGKEYTLSTIPTLSSVLDFDVRKNQPDFVKMLEKRMKQAMFVEDAQRMYKEVFGYSDYEIEQLDPDDYADDIMQIINALIWEQEAASACSGNEDEMFDDFDDIESQVETNVEQLKINAEQKAKHDARHAKKFAGGFLSAADLINGNGKKNAQFDIDIAKVYVDIKGDMWNDRDYFTVVNGNLCGLDGTKYIINNSDSDTLKNLNAAAKDEKSRVFADGDIKSSDLKAIGTYEITDAFYQFLAEQEQWSFAKGKFELGMKKVMSQG